MGEVWRRFARWEVGLCLLIVLVTCVGVLTSSSFLNSFNLQTMALNATVLGFLALGVAPVIMAGDIDISVASTLALCGVVMAVLWQNGMDIWVAAIVAVLLGTVLGLVNGVLVVVLNLPSLAITLGTQGAYTGIAFLILQGTAISNFPDALVNLGSADAFGTVVPSASLILLVFGIVLGFLVHRTTFGKAIFAIGGNREAARFSGIPVARVRIFLFAIAGAYAALAGVLYVGYFNSIQANSAIDDVLPAITIVILGGVSAYGGTGTIGGVFLALILLGLLEGLMGVVGLSGQGQSIGVGILLIVAIAAGAAIRSTTARLSGRVRPPTRKKEETSINVAPSPERLP